MKALIVDDSATMRRVLKTTLIKADFDEFDEAETGAEAVSKVQDEMYDLILMDWNMPEMSGLDAVIEIRRLGEKVPIMMVTTENEKGKIIEAIKAGANNYIVKPFKPDSVIFRIKETLNNQSE